MAGWEEEEEGVVEGGDIEGNRGRGVRGNRVGNACRRGGGGRGGRWDSECVGGGGGGGVGGAMRVVEEKE